MKSNNKPDSLVAACVGMAATFLTVVVLSGCGGGAGSGGYAPPPPLPPNNDIADGSVSGITYTITSFKTGLGSFIAVDNSGAGASPSNAAVTLDTDTHGSEGSVSANLTITSMPAGANPWIGITSKNNGGLADWSPYRYLRFSVTTGAAGYNGMAAIKTGSGYTWCDAKSPTSIAANSTGTVTLDLTTCSGASLADVKEFLIYSNTTGTFYIDNVRLEKDTTVTAPDIADGKTNGNIFTISSFKTGLGGFRALNDNDKIAAGGTAALDTVVAHATEGTNSAAVTVSNIPAGASSVGLALDSNGGLADWSAYRYLKADIITGATDFNGTVSILSGNAWTYCDDQTWPLIKANTASATLVMDLTACPAGTDLANVKRIQIQNKLLGTFNIDNVRLEKGSAPPAATDVADGSSTTNAGVTTTVLTSFHDGVGSFGVYDTSANASAVLATVTLESPSAAATEGNSVAVVDMAQKGAATPDAFVGGTPSVTNWTGALHLKADMQATEGIYWVQLITKSGAGWNWCDDHGASANLGWNVAGTISFTLSAQTCGSGTFDPTNVQAYYLLVQGSSGTYRIDNIRLTTD